MSARHAFAALAVAVTLVGVAGCADSKSAGEVSLGVDQQSNGHLPAGSKDDPKGDDSEQSGPHLTAKSIVPAMTRGMEGLTTMHVVMTMRGSMSMRASVDMDTSSSDPAMDMTMSGADIGGKMRMILVDGRMYVSGATLPPGRFVSYDASDSSNPMAATARSMADSASPADQLTGWDRALKSVTYVGRDSVDGVEAGHYKISIDMAKALAARGQKLSPGIPKTLTYDAWLDSGNRMVKLSFDVAGMTTTLITSDWGKPVHISKPPSAKVIGIG